MNPLRNVNYNLKDYTRILSNPNTCISSSAFSGHSSLGGRDQKPLRTQLGLAAMCREEVWDLKRLGEAAPCPTVPGPSFYTPSNTRAPAWDKVQAPAMDC